MKRVLSEKRMEEMRKRMTGNDFWKKTISTQFKKGHRAFCKPKKYEFVTCLYCNKTFKHPSALKNRKFCNLQCRNEDYKKRRLTIEQRLQRSMTMKKLGSKHRFWKGGITPANQKIRNSIEYKLWREAVFKRDDFRCTLCGNRQSKGHKVILNADHIKPFSTHPDLRLDINNGRTLCLPCHKETPSYLNKYINY